MLLCDHAINQSINPPTHTHTHQVFIRETDKLSPDDAPDGQGYVKETEWMLDTEGVNLLEVRALRVAPRGARACRACVLQCVRCGCGVHACVSCAPHVCVCAHTRK